MQTNFKILTYASRYVDVNRLNEGIYETAIPFLYHSETTIDELVKRAENVRYILGDDRINGKYFEMLKQCILLDFKLVAQAG